MNTLTVTRRLGTRKIALRFILSRNNYGVRPNATFNTPRATVNDIRLVRGNCTSLRLSIRDVNKRSDHPFNNASLKHLSNTVTSVAHTPFSIRLGDTVANTFRALTPCVARRPLGALIRSIHNGTSTVTTYYVNSPSLFPFIAAAVTPAVVHNNDTTYGIVPRSVATIVGFHLTSKSAIRDIVTRYHRTIRSGNIRVHFLRTGSPSTVTGHSNCNCHEIIRDVRHCFPSIIFVPSVATNTASTRHCRRVYSAYLQYDPFVARPTRTTSNIRNAGRHLLIHSCLRNVHMLVSLVRRTGIRP